MKVVTMNEHEISNLINLQKNFFYENHTKNIDFRIFQLRKLLATIEKNEAEIIKAIRKDLGRSDVDAYLGDISPIKKSIKYHIKHIKEWAKPKKVKSILPGSLSFIYPEPLGNVLIISPWNYPFLVLIDPLIGVISAGNCAILKPSEISSNTSKILNKIISETFSPEYIKVIEGGVEETQFLLRQKFDHIFFTGSTTVGKIVYEAAAKNLTPVILELGGKSPCIVDKDIDFRKTADRIIWGKTFNCGQTCTAPDHVFVDKSIKDKFIQELKVSIEKFYGENPQESKFYSRIINEKHFDRLMQYLKNGKIIYGGKTDKSDLYIEPTLIEDVEPDFKILQDEIFGPILPIMEYENIENVIQFVKSRPKPLALYVFSRNKIFCNNIVSKISAGGMCINDTLMHAMSDESPFGGVGNSGIGKYHGKYGFDALSNQKSIFKNTFLIDRNILYPPYKLSFKWFKKIIALLT